MRAYRLTGVFVLCLVIAGCSSTVSGKATVPAGAAAPATSAAPATPTTLPPKDAKTVLLKRSELSEILGDGELKEVDDYSDTAHPSGIEPTFGCPSRFIPNASSAYYQGPDNQRKAMVGNGNSGAGGRYAGQIVAVYDTPLSVDVAMSAVSGDWREGCPDGTEITLTAGDETQAWTAGPVLPPVDSWTKPHDIDRVSTTSRREQPSSRVCASVMAAQRTVLVESLVCAPDDSAATQAGAIVDRLLTKVPK